MDNKKVSCVAIIKNSDGNILLGKRNDSFLWSFVGGGLEGDETISECISREVLEEVGIFIKPESFTLVDSQIVENGMTVHVFEVTVSNEVVINVKNDIDQEFSEAGFYNLGWILNKAELHIPRNKNIVIDYLLEKYPTYLDNINMTPQEMAKDLGIYLRKYADGGAILRDLEQNIILDTDSCEEVKMFLESKMKDKNNIEADSLTFKESRDITKEIKKDKEALLDANFKDGRVILKRLKENYAKLNVENITTATKNYQDVKQIDFLEAKRILEKENATLEDLSYFTDEMVETIVKQTILGNEKFIELSKLANAIAMR